MKIKEIIDARNKMSKEANDARLSWCKKYLSVEAVARMTPDGINAALTPELDEITETEMQSNRAFNKMLVAEVSAMRDKVKDKYYAAFQKPADYATQIANALELLKTLPLTEDNVEMVLTPFKEDYGQMKVFQCLVETMDNDECQREGRRPMLYETTFAQVRACTSALTEYDEIKDIAKDIFVYPKHALDVVRNGAYQYVLAYDDSYDEMSGQARLLNFADKVANHAD